MLIWFGLSYLTEAAVESCKYNNNNAINFRLVRVNIIFNYNNLLQSIILAADLIYLTE